MCNKCENSKKLVEQDVGGLSTPESMALDVILGLGCPPEIASKVVKLNRELQAKVPSPAATNQIDRTDDMSDLPQELKDLISKLGGEVKVIQADNLEDALKQFSTELEQEMSDSQAEEEDDTDDDYDVTVFPMTIIVDGDASVVEVVLKEDFDEATALLDEASEAMQKASYKITELRAIINEMSGFVRVAGKQGADQNAAKVFSDYLRSKFPDTFK